MNKSNKGKTATAAQSHASTAASTPKEISQREAEYKSWLRDRAKKDDDELTSLRKVLIYSDDDGPAMAAKVLCAVEFLIDVETEYGNQDLPGWVAHGLSEIIHHVVGSLHRMASAAGREETQS